MGVRGLSGAVDGGARDGEGGCGGGGSHRGGQEDGGDVGVPVHARYSAASHNVGSLCFCFEVGVFLFCLLVLCSSFARLFVLVR